MDTFPSDCNLGEKCPKHDKKMTKTQGQKGNKQQKWQRWFQKSCEKVTKNDKTQKKQQKAQSYDIKNLITVGCFCLHFWQTQIFSLYLSNRTHCKRFSRETKLWVETWSTLGPDPVVEKHWFRLRNIELDRICSHEN